MITFSPNYDFITLVVKERKSDSTREWFVDNTSTRLRSLNMSAGIPIIGGFIGIYRVVTGIADVVSGIINNSFYQTVIGVKNIFYGFLQTISACVGLICGVATMSFIVLVVTTLLSNCVVILIINICSSVFLGKRNETTAPVSVYHDNICAFELRPRNSFLFYTEDKWFSEVEKYGTRTDYPFFV